MIEAHRVAQEFYAAYLLAAGDARAGRDFMRERGFDGAVAKRFGVGFAPRGGEVVRGVRIEKTGGGGVYSEVFFCPGWPVRCAPDLPEGGAVGG